MRKELLREKLDKKHIKTRSQSGQSLSYIEAWHAIAEANRIFNEDGWTRETVDIRCVSERDRSDEGKDGWRVTYTAKVRVTVLNEEETGWVTREGCGAGHGIDRQLGQAHESALKEAESDAMKRALMTFGWPFGLALYDKAQEHVGDPEAEERAAQAAVATCNKARSCTSVEELTAMWKALPAQLKADQSVKDAFREVGAELKKEAG